jgi:GNAT superfamily N-acetyltransferase
MALDAVRIERIKLKDLTAVAASAVDGAKAGDFIPITKHRAAAMAHNPNADPDDVALLLAREGDRNVGFFGVMPVMLQHEGKLHKVHWLTTWGVAPEFLGKGLGSRLMEEALALDVDLAIVGSKPARRVSAKYAFVETPPLHYIGIDFGIAGRYNPLSLLLRLIRKLLSLVGLRIDIRGAEAAVARFFDAIFSPILRPLLYAQLERKLGKDTHTVRVEPVAQVKPLAKSGVNTTGFYRGAEVVNWMLAHPWVVHSGQSASERMNYGFTDARKDFEIIAWQALAPSGEKLGYVVFQSSVIRGRRVLKVLDHEFVPSALADLLAALALRQGRRVRADIIEGPLHIAAPLGKSLLVHRKQRTLQLHPRAANSPLAAALPALQQTYVDGDTAFT